MKKKYKVIDLDTGECFHYSILQWYLGFTVVFLLGILSGVLIVIGMISS